MTNTNTNTNKSCTTCKVSLDDDQREGEVVRTNSGATLIVDPRLCGECNSATYDGPDTSAFLTKYLDSIESV